MSIGVIASIEYGSYVSILKLLTFFIAFMAWIPLVNWVFTDSQAVRTNTFLWTLLIISSGILGLFIWLILPFFLIGLLFYLIILPSVAMTYVVHRNGQVAEFEKVLTGDHLRSFFSNPSKKINKGSRGITFFTVNDNEVPQPEAKSKELEGFLVTCELIDDAAWHRADVIRLIPEKENYSVIYEIDGVPSKQDPRATEEIDNFIYYMKQLAGLEVEEKRKPQKGHFGSALQDSKRIDWEVTTSGSTAGEQVKIEKASELVSRKVPDLGLNENQLEPIEGLKNLTEGLILVTGPKKSGVTTTFYTLLGAHDPFLNNINTLETDTDAVLQNITQFKYTLSDTGTTTFARRLQTLLRRGPDIVGVGTCEDAQTAGLASAAAKDGKVIYVVLEANSVNEAVAKWLGLVKDKDLVADTLQAVLNQRLVRKLCEDCRQPYQPNPALFKKFNIPANGAGMFYRPGEIEYDKHGKPIVCDTCHGSGFYGRIGLFETIRITDELRDSIRKAKTPQEIATAFRRDGMLYIQEQSIKKLASGVTSINEVIRNFAAKTK